jgi:hypothetical protein
LIPYLKDAKRREHRAFLKKDKLMVNGRAYDMEYLLGNTQKQELVVWTPLRITG